MTIDKLRRRKAFFDIDVVTRAEAYAPIARQLAAFNDHRRDLLDHLRKAHERGPKSAPFNAEKVWLDLAVIAKLYFWQEIGTQETTSPEERFKRLCRLGRAVARARALADRTLQQDIGGDVFRAWFAETRIPIASAMCISKDGSSVATRIVDDIEKAVAGLASLETAVFTAAAANAVPPKSGRPPLLPSDCIQGLARVYRSSTCRKPGRGDGPFARFLFEFIATVRPDFEFKYDSVIDAIKNAHHRFTPSWFDE